MNDSLTAPFPPFFHVVYGSRRDLSLALATIGLPEETVVRTVRGGKMRTRSAVFDEMAAALQFPWYFGQNWDALDECLRDLDWLGAKHVIVAIADASELLADAPEREGETFAAIITRATMEHDSDILRSFHVVLQAPPDPPPDRLDAWFGPLEPLGGSGCKAG